MATLSYGQAQRLGLHGFGGATGRAFARASFGGEWEDYCDRTYDGNADLLAKCKKVIPLSPPWTLAGKAIRGLPVTWSAVSNAASDVANTFTTQSSAPAPGAAGNPYVPGSLPSSQLPVGSNPYLDAAQSSNLSSWGSLASSMPKVFLAAGAVALGVGLILYLKKRGARSGASR